MKILYISVGSGGSDRALLNTLDGLLPYGIEPFVVINERNSLLTELVKRKIQYNIVDYKFDIWPKHQYLDDKIKYIYRLFTNPVKNHFAVNKIKKIAVAFKADIIHTNAGIFQIGYKVADSIKIPHVWHLREYQDLDFNMKPFPSKKSFLSKLYSNRNYSISITKGIYDHFNLNSERAKWIYDGVQKSNQTQIIYKKNKYFLFVGRLTVNKGITELIDAFIDFVKFDNEYELWLCAKLEDNEFCKSIREKINTNGLQNRIKFLGYRSDVNDLMSKASVLIVPSKFEGFGLITAEAMFNGCLVIGKNTGGTKEQFDNGLEMTGAEIAIRYENTGDLTEAMIQLKNNGVEFYFQMINRAQKTVVSLYSIENNAEQISLVYNQIYRSPA